MDEQENILIEKLFQEAALQQIDDNGFTDRVMAQLPGSRAGRERRLTRLWTLFCVVCGGALFFVFNGWETLKDSLWQLVETVLAWLGVLLTTAPTADLRLDPALVLLLLAFVLVVLPYQTARKLSTAL